MTIANFESLPAAKQQLVIMACSAAGFDFYNECASPPAWTTFY